MYLTSLVIFALLYEKNFKGIGPLLFPAQRLSFYSRFEYFSMAPQTVLNWQADSLPPGKSRTPYVVCIKMFLQEMDGCFPKEVPEESFNLNSRRWNQTTVSSKVKSKISSKLTRDCLTLGRATSGQILQQKLFTEKCLPCNT